MKQFWQLCTYQTISGICPTYNTWAWRRLEENWHSNATSPHTCSRSLQTSLWTVLVSMPTVNYAWANKCSATCTVVSSWTLVCAVACLWHAWIMKFANYILWMSTVSCTKCIILYKYWDLLILSLWVACASLLTTVHKQFINFLKLQLKVCDILFLLYSVHKSLALCYNKLLQLL